VLSDIIEEAAKFLFWLIVETIFFFTGEIVLYIATFGRRSPRWDFYVKETPAWHVVMTEVSVWIGALFWIISIGFLARRLLG
jgi:hypothetical protein